MADLALLTGAALLGFFGAPHCTAMCSAPCAAALGGGGSASSASFHVARAAGYAAAGALAAGTVSGLASWSVLSPALRPLWALLNAAALVLGMSLLVRGRQPAWLTRFGRVATTPSSPVQGRWQVMRGPMRAAAAGGLWFAWPCGLLQSALVMAALTSHAGYGALAMLGFAITSAPGLIAGPWLLRRIMSNGGGGATRDAWAIRAAGLVLAAASAWALTRHLAPEFAAYCSSL